MKYPFFKEDPNNGLSCWQRKIPYINQLIERKSMNKMRPYLLIKLLVIAVMSIGAATSIDASSCGTECCPRTFFRARSLTQDLVLELALSQYRNHHQFPDVAPCWLSLEVTPFYYKSRNSRELAGYFLPNCQSCITIGENNTSDISSPWLGLTTATCDGFQSTMCICPERQVVGAALKFYVSGESFFEGCLSRTWASLFVPVARVRTDLHIRERLTGTQGIIPELQTGIQALNNPEWNCSTFPVCKQTKSGISDVQIKVGADLWRDECSGGGLFVMAYLPPSNESHSCTIFEPTLGSGEHGGIGAGAYADTTFWEGCDSSLTALAEVRYLYLFKSTEVRSFDLRNCALSRYLLFANAISPQIPFPGINFLTFPVQVTPRSNVEAWAAIHYAKCDWHVEVGYDFWWRQAEKICLPCDPFVQQVSVFDIVSPQITPQTLSTYTSASTACISQGILSADNAPVKDAVFTPLTLQNLNIQSAAHPKAMSSKVYGSFAWDVSVYDYCGLLGLGVSYEHAHRNSALSQVGVWVKLNMSY